MTMFSEPEVLKAIGKAHALRAGRVFREIGPPPVFGKENHTDSEHGSVSPFLAPGSSPLPAGEGGSRKAGDG